jgi:fatty acid desaturase
MNLSSRVHPPRSLLPCRAWPEVDRAQVLRHPRWDSVLIALALLHGALLLWAPSLWLVALGLWWSANTISHNFIHLPFFRCRAANAVFSAYLSLVLGLPQTLWRDRHLAHHAGRAWRLRWSRALQVETGLVAGLWLVLLWLAPPFFFAVYIPGYLLGLCLCQVQGHYEHARGPVSHYGRLYNLLFFNDGYHVEHHARPAEHWARLPLRRRPGATSRWPAVLRWLELGSLDTLERLVVRSKRLQQFVLRNHERAFRKVLSPLPAVRKVGIIGGGLFPRTALVLQRVWPGTELAVLDANVENLQRARDFVQGGVEFTHGFYAAGAREDWLRGVELLVIPLAFAGDRAAIYRHPPAPHVLVHDWLWRRRPGGAVVSWPLLKCLNLVHR